MNKHKKNISKNRSVRVKKAKKGIALATFVSCFIAATTVNAFAASGGFQSAASDALVTVVTLIGGGLGAWGVVNLLEGYGGDNGAAKSQGIKQAVAGVGLIIVATTIIPSIFS